MTPSDRKYDLLLHRVFQYVTVIGILALLGGGYWYWKNARAAVETVDNRPSFEAPLTHDLDLTAGQGSATYSRADGADRRATVTDFEGLIHPVKQNEARFDGARRVENLLSYSQTFENAAWLKLGTGTPATATDSSTAAPDGTMTGSLLDVSGATDDRIAQTKSVTPGTYVFSAWLKQAGSGGTVKMETSGVGIASATVTPTSTWQRFSTNVTVTASGNLNVYPINRTSGGTATAVYAWGAQLEEVTGQSNQNPSEYVSVGVKTSAPYHGAGVDGVKYFDTENGNTVASNVVTEATGTAIATATLKGYLAEGARTNSATNSEVAGSWILTDSSVTTNATTAPDGRTTADLVTQGTAGTASANSNSPSWSAGVVGTASVYLKRGNNDWQRVTINGGANQINAWFNLSSGVTGSTSASGTGTVSGSAITDIGNGWYRCSVSGSFSSAQTGNIFLSAVTANVSSTRADNATYYTWGGQIELSARFASSYIPTTSAAVTRAMDSLSYPLSGNSNDTEGTFLAVVTPNWTNETESDAFFISNSSHTRRMSIWHWAGSAKMLVADRSADSTVTRNTASDVSQDLSEGVTTNLAMKYDDSSVKLFRDGSLRGTDSTLTLPYDSLINNLYIGKGTNSTTHSFSNVKSVRAWEKALTDTELNNLTSLTQSTSDSAVKETTVKAPDNTGLVGYWSFEDGSGTKAEDFSASGTNTGTLTNMEAGDWVDGKFGKALVFDGVNEYVNVPNATSLNPGTGNFTISAWIRVDSTPTDFRRLINKGAGSIFYAFVKFPGDKWKFEFRDGTLSTGDLDFGSSTMTYGNWTHLVATVDQGNSLTSGYLDGALKDTSSIAGYATVSNTDYLSLGRSSIDAPYAIDDVRIYDRALSQAEVADLYRSGSATKLNASQNDQLTDGLVGLWSFNGPDVSGTTAYDRSGQGNDGTLTNGPTTAVGKVGQTLSFDGVNDYVSLPDVADLKPTGDFSIAFWYKGLKGSVESFIGHSPSPLTNYWYINNVKATFCGGTNCSASIEKTYTLPSDNEWHHLAVILDRSTSPDTLTVYIDSVSQGTETGTTDGSAGGWGSTTWIGGPSWVNSGYRQGAMDEVRIYNRTLSASEVRSLYDAGQ